MAIPPVILTVTLGLAAGSFINALVWRLHQQAGAAQAKRKSTQYSLLGRSVCPKCRQQLKAADLIPLLSWLALKGCCRYCKRPISWQYPAVELLMGALFVVSFLVWDFTPGTIAVLELVIWLLQLTLLGALVVYDLRWMLLPNRLMYPLLGLALLQLGTYAALGLPLQVWLVGPVAAALVFGGSFYALHLLSRGAWMGGGDVKLVFVLGLMLGLQLTAAALFVSFILAAAVSLLLIALKLKTRKDLIPFGPFIILGAVIARLFGHELVGAYLNLVRIV